MLNSSVADLVSTALLATFRQSFRAYKALSDCALAQLSEAEWLHMPAPGSNSAAVIVQHLAGNLRSRFTDFLTSDGEKPAGQLVQLAKIIRGEAFQSLSIPRGQSEQFNQTMTGSR